MRVQKRNWRTPEKYQGKLLPSKSHRLSSRVLQVRRRPQDPCWCAHFSRAMIPVICDDLRKYRSPLSPISTRPDNLCVIIAGSVDHLKILESLKEFDDKIASRGKLPASPRPWSSPVPPLQQSVDKIVEFGADDEDHGMVLKS